MKKAKLHADALKVDSFTTVTDPTDTRGTVVNLPNGCICFAALHLLGGPGLQHESVVAPASAG